MKEFTDSIQSKQKWQKFLNDSYNSDHVGENSQKIVVIAIRISNAVGKKWIDEKIKLLMFFL